MRYLTFRDLQKKLGGRGRSTIYRDVKAGRLPKPIKLGARLYWIEGEIDATLASAGESTPPAGTETRVQELPDPFRFGGQP